MKSSPWLIAIALVVLLFSMSLGSCKKEQFATGGNQLLDFTNDTVFFDTVFTSIGSTTQYFKVYNRHDDPIKISQIRLDQGSSSAYRINVDGISGASHNDIVIAENDSMFILIEVTVDPTALTTPFVEEDLLVFDTNGQTQNVVLSAWGQNAVFHGSPVNLITNLECSEEWNANLPHVVYGIVRVEEGCNLVINAGTQVYSHANSGIWVDGGTITVNGELGNEVCFQGDRLEPIFSDEPGQWGIQVDIATGEDFSSDIVTISRGGIWITESEGNLINYAVLKNGVIGIQVDTLSNPGVDALVLTNTKILNMSAIGLLGQGSSMSGFNNLVGNCGQACGQFAIGGSYRFDHCTFGNYWSFGVRQSPTFSFSNYYQTGPPLSQTIVRDFTNTYFRNCIMYGNNANLDEYNEFAFDVIDEEMQPQEYFFEDCFVDTDLDMSDGAHFVDMTSGQTPQFTDPVLWDFTLNYSSEPQSLVGSLTIGDPDLAGNTRGLGTGPEMGCYEYVP